MKHRNRMPASTGAASLRHSWLAIVIVLVSCVESPERLAQPLELGMTVRTAEIDDSLSLELFMPSRAGPIKAIVAFIDRGLDRYAFDDRDWREMCRRAGCALIRFTLPRQGELPFASQLVRNATLGGGAALIDALRSAAELSRQPELSSAPILFFGFSAAGSFGATFAGWNPSRTIGFILYHGALRGVALDTAALMGIPALIVAGAMDQTAGSDPAEFWRAFRARGARWALSTHVNQGHSSIDGLVESGPAMRAWAEAIIRRHAGQDPSVQTLSEGWLLDSTGFVVPGSASTPSLMTSWVPDLSTAQELRLLGGLCGLLARDLIANAMASDIDPTVNEPETCHYSLASPRRDLWLSTSRFPDESSARFQLAQGAQSAPSATAIEGIGDSAFFILDEVQKCSSIGMVRRDRQYFVSICGPAFAEIADSVLLRPLAIRLVGGL